MPGRTERRPLLPPPLAAWLGAWSVRVLWAAGGLGLVWGWVALEPAASGSGAPPPGVAVVAPALRPSTGGTVLDSVPAGHAPQPLTSPRPRRSPRARAAVRVTATAPPPPATAAPAAGTYRYAVSSDGQSSTAELVVGDRSPSDTGTFLEEDWSTDAGVERRGETWSAAAEDELWSSDGTSRCDYRPASVLLELPLSVGRSWQGGGSCAYDDQDGRPVVLRQSTAARVVAAAHADQDGRRMFCWVIERDVITTVTTSGAVATSETRTTDLFSPALGLMLYQTGKSAYPDGAGNIQSYTWTAQLD